ncbi:DUF1266 domain-containing protein [Catenulispora pinisilvae]|uniref:DUF1266 domain-containing protein n=1 Tax=Catenulispora pinisilvae TaxID=2705253 RepID=UPI0018914ACA|nr:DUF1266 domain-containing protein [Catenulispora pinisilvae]
MTTDNWTAPSIDDQRLLAAQAADDGDAYLAALARLDVYVPRRDPDQASKFSLRKSVVKLNQFSVYGQLNNAIRGTSKSALTVSLDYDTHRRGARLILPVYTRALVPAEQPEGVYFHRVLFPSWVQSMAKQRQTMQLVINPGTPEERELNVGKAAQWMRKHPHLLGSWNALHGTVRTIYNEPTQGEFARAMACGAHLAAGNAVPWNSLGYSGLDYHTQRESLQEWWGIEGPVQWQNQVDTLLDNENPQPVDLVLGIRNERGAGVRPSGDPVHDTRLLTDAVEAWCRDRGAPERLRQDMTDIAQWVVRCETWLRRDGALGPDQIVVTQDSWDWGRCVNMARWGVACGFCDRTTAEQIVLRAGSLCARAYPDWAALSVAYILGRVIKMGRQGNPEESYRDTLQIHQTLMRDPASPFLTVPLH